MNTGNEDRELLEKAAKAAGMTAHRYCEAWKAMVRYTIQDGFHGPSWNPLTDDGDALRLADELAIDVLQRFVGGRRAEALPPGGPRIAVFAQHHNGDTLAATRRAIVRAAAALSASTSPPEPA